MKVGCLLREVVYSAVHVGIHIEVFLAHGVEHAEWFLRGGGVVEVDKRFAVYLAAEYREVLTDFFNVVHIIIGLIRLIGPIEL